MKKMLALFVVMTMLVSMGSQVSATQSTVRLGHVLGNDTIEIKDVLEILKWIVNTESVIDKGNGAWKAALVTGGDKPTVNDALELLKHIVGMDSKIGNVSNVEGKKSDKKPDKDPEVEEPEIEEPEIEEPEVEEPEEDPIDTEVSLSRRLEIRIRTDFSKHQFDTLSGLAAPTAAHFTIYKYLGSYNGCEAVMVTDSGRSLFARVTGDRFPYNFEPVSEWNDVVAGYTFNYLDTREIYIWNGGNIQKLGDAFNSGLLTQENVGAIHAEYTRLFDFYQRIRDDFTASYIGGDEYVSFIEHFYGMYNGGVAMMVSSTGLVYTTNVWTEKVAGYSFVYGSGQRILYWKDGVFHTLSSAFGDESGLLTAKDIDNIWFHRTASDINNVPIYDDDFV